MKIHRRLRRFGAAVAATAMLVGVAACGSDTDSDTTDSADGATTDTVVTGEFPVTVSGKFGDATIEAEPVRALPLSPQDADILLSLGITPIALPVDAQNLAATDGTGVWPWEADALGGDVPPLLNMEGGATVIAEQIAALEPDVVVSTGFWGLDENGYDQLSSQFPVVHFDVRANGEPWQDSTRKIATAMGIPEKADEVIEEAEAHLVAAQDEHPDLVGATYNAIIGDTGGQLSVLAADDRGIGQFLNSLGLELSDYAGTLDVDADGRGVLSYEEISQLDADLLVVVSPTGDLEYLTKFEAWNRLPAVERGSVVSIARNTGMPNALGFPSALSLTWATDEIAPVLADAAAKSE